MSDFSPSKEGVIVVASGGRDYRDDAMIAAVLGNLHKERNIVLLIQGECPVGDGGADERARKWAKKNEVNYMGIPPKVKKYGWPLAGPARNQEMASCKPDIWVLFPGGRGTSSAKECAIACGAEIIEVEYE